MSLKLSHVTKNYGTVEVLHDIDISIEEGDFLVLLGASGCGKSTILNCIAGLEETTRGQILMKGRDVTRVDASDRNVAMVFQSYALYPTMTVERNIAFGLECQGVAKSARRAAVAKVAEMLHITPLLDRKPSQLSGGQRQRVAIGRALVRNPDIFLLDEPMSNLDAKLRNQMRFELRELHRKLKATFVLVTHDQIEAMSMATKVAVIDKGRVQQFGTPYDVYYTPQNMFVAAFVGVNKMNFLHGTFELDGNRPQIRINSRIASLEGYQFAGGLPKHGTPVVLGLRPENIYRSKDRLEGAHYLEALLPVLRSELTGGDVQVWFDLEGQSIAGRFRSSRTPEDGAMAELFLDLKNASLFDRGSEQRL
ncbi:MAG: ABC transporter ATP-binding protein [Rhodobacteraceae bacterium]|nr:ABC transporter ATP-binding protein [Paracoccaceae bacterium]